MAKKSKLELVMELSDKLFNNKLSQVQAKLSNATDKMEGKLKHFNMTQIKIFKGIGEAFDPVKINQAFELFDTVSEKLDFTKDINKTKVALQQMGVENIDEVSDKIHQIKTIFGEDSMEIAKAANAMTKQIGGSFIDNLDLMEKAFNKGANLNGDMLDQLKEYGPAMRENGIGIKDMLSIMAQSGKDGVFSDKALDSLKEGGLSLREFGKAQEDALNGIGMKVSDLTGKTSWEAMQMISKTMKGMTTQARQLVLADIFKGAGEDGGMALIEGFASGIKSFDDIPEFKQLDNDMNSWLARFQSSIANTLGSLPIQDIAAFVMTTAGLISIITTLNGVMSFTAMWTKTVTAAQWLWNAAMTANPIGLLVVAIGALIGLVVLAINKWDTWGAAIMVFLGPIGMVISAFKSLYDHWDSIKKAFQTDGIIGGLKRIGLVLLDAVLKPMQQLLEVIAKIDPTGLAQKGVDKIKAFREASNLITPGEKDPRLNPDPNPINPKGLTPLSKAPVLDGKIATNGKKTKKTGEDISKAAGQANQVRNIDIRFESFIKGGVNLAQGAVEGMSKDDLEAWLKEMFRRLIINAETN